MSAFPLRITAGTARAMLKATQRKSGRYGRVAPKDQRTVDGIVFDSKRESARYQELKFEERAGMICDIIVQPDFPVWINGTKFCTYTADFSFFDKILGQSIYEDVKSAGTAKDTAYRLRKKAAELFHGIKITEVIR